MKLGKTNPKCVKRTLKIRMRMDVKPIKLQKLIKNFKNHKPPKISAISLVPLERAWPASVAFFPAALALAKALSPIKAAHQFLVVLSSGAGAGVRGCWRRGRVGAVAGWAGLEGGGPSATWAQMSRGCLEGCALSLSPWPRRGPAIGHGIQRGPATL